MAQPPGAAPRERRARLEPDESQEPQSQEARESPYTHNEKHESEEVLGRRTFLRDASTFLRRRLEDPVRPS